MPLSSDHKFSTSEGVAAIRMTPYVVSIKAQGISLTSLFTATMYIFQSVFFLGMTASALAQLFDIGAPAPGATLTAGVPFVVEVDQPVS